MSIGERDTRIYVRDPAIPRRSFKDLSGNVPDIVRTCIEGVTFDVSRDSTIPPSAETFRHGTRIGEAVRSMLETSGVKPITIVEVGTGSGVFAVAVAKQVEDEMQSENPRVRLVAIDLVPAALRDARHNIDRAGIVGINLVQADCLEALHHSSSESSTHGGVDILFSHPPFLSEESHGGGENLTEAQRSFYPKTAMHAGKTGQEFYERLLNEAPAVLSPRGVLVIQHLDWNVEALLSMIRTDELMVAKKLFGKRQTALAIGYPKGIVETLPGERIGLK